MRAGTPWISALDDARADRLRGLAARFLHQKTITPLAGLDLDDSQRLQLAALTGREVAGQGGHEQEEHQRQHIFFALDTEREVRRDE